ncbi:MAG: hypothetical protein ABJE95_25170 [Byssovorax sp.]
MQVGEPAAAAAGGGTAARTEWEALVIEITFKTDITSALDRAAIAAPHWKEGEDPTDSFPMARQLHMGSGPFSKKAATYKVKAAGGPTEVEVKVRVTKCVNVSGTGALKGVLGSLEIHGSCPLAAGEHTISAHIQEMPKEIAYFHGMMNWRVEASPFGQRAMNGTLVELFFVLDTPYSRYTAGVWVEALRLVCLRGPVTGIGKSDDLRAVGNITRYCHTDHEMYYDVWHGASDFVPGGAGGDFQLWNYLHRATRKVNCYDQAGAVQSLAGCLGIRPTWIYLRPYGFIRETSLVGWPGQCNSPFFRAIVAVMVLGQNDAARTSFNNHAFIEHGSVAPGLGAAIGVGAALGGVGGGVIGAIAGGGVGALIGALAGAVVGAVIGAAVALGAESGGYIFDACAGPHIGTESRTQYLAAGIDKATTLYGTGYHVAAPGVPGNMVVYPGVAAII